MEGVLLIQRSLAQRACSHSFVEVESVDHKEVERRADVLACRAEMQEEELSLAVGTKIQLNRGIDSNVLYYSKKTIATTTLLEKSVMASHVKN